VSGWFNKYHSQRCLVTYHII